MENKNKRDLTHKLLQFVHERGKSVLNDFINANSEKAGSIYTIADRLEKGGLLEKNKKQNGRRLQNFFEITDKGRARLFSTSKKSAVAMKKIWDGLWRLLIFDIPEEEKDTRDYFRYELKKRGFYMLQLSVWLTPYPVDEEVKEIIDEMGVKYYVRLMIVKEISYEKDIIKFFGL